MEVKEILKGTAIGVGGVLLAGVAIGVAGNVASTIIYAWWAFMKYMEWVL